MIGLIPSYYFAVFPVSLLAKPIKIPDMGHYKQHKTMPSIDTVTGFKENMWLRYVKECLNDEGIESSCSEVPNVLWSAHHADWTKDTILTTCTINLMPLFPDHANSTATIRNAIHVIRRAITYLNPGQIPVLTCDQPLYATCK